jgi:peptidoglycan/xylan/chitin deacetylase (PgdA/CDA1 family)
MRPPYGAVTPAVQNYLASQGLKTALWTADTQDWRHQDNSQSTYAAIMGAAKDGQVILVHDIHLASVEAVERAIPELRQQGYQLVTMSELGRYRH